MAGGRRFLHHVVQFADDINKPIHLLYYPPYHSKYNPIERCWGILELKWNGTKLSDAETMLEWAKRMTWKRAASDRLNSATKSAKGHCAREGGNAGG